MCNLFREPGICALYMKKTQQTMSTTETAMNSQHFYNALAWMGSANAGGKTSGNAIIGTCRDLTQGISLLQLVTTLEYELAYLRTTNWDSLVKIQKGNSHVIFLYSWSIYPSMIEFESFSRSFSNFIPRRSWGLSFWTDAVVLQCISSSRKHPRNTMVHIAPSWWVKTFESDEHAEERVCPKF